MAFFKKKPVKGELEAAKDVYVYEMLPSALRIQLAQILGSQFATARRGPTYICAADLWQNTYQSFAHDQGVWEISPGQHSPMDQCLVYLQTQPSALLTLKLVQTGIREYMEATREPNMFIPGGMSLPGPPPPLPIVAQVNQKLKEHRIGYEFIGGDLHQIDSSYLHEETVKPIEQSGLFGTSRRISAGACTSSGKRIPGCHP